MHSIPYLELGLSHFAHLSRCGILELTFHHRHLSQDLQLFTAEASIGSLE